MKSIRLSLIVYFLLLLAAAVGTASVLAFSTAANSLRAKQAINRDLLESRTDDRIREVGKQLDDELLSQALYIARITAAHNQFSRVPYIRLFELGQMTAPQAHLTAPIWFFEADERRGPSGFNNPLYWAVRGRLLNEMTFNEDELPRTGDTTDQEFFQINCEWSRPWRSKSLGDTRLPYDRNQFGSLPLFHSTHDEFALTTGLHVRRVQLKVSATRFRFPPPRGPQPGAGRPGGRRPPPTDQPPPPPPRERMENIPWIVIHCASTTNRRDTAIANLRSDLVKDLADLDEQAREELTSLRQRLVWIGVLTFIATTFGCSLLVGLGLSPLRRLTEAVSRVSPKDFRLPLPADARLPMELAPIRQRLQQTLDELRHAFEREKQATADISHELRTPVASILTAAEVALRKPRSAEDYRQTLEDCRDIARQMRQLVERLLALARLDVGSDQVKPSEVDVVELVNDCATLVRPLAGERDLELRVHCPKPVTWTTDPYKLREVLVNLLHNAVQYNKPGGSIDVSAQADGPWLDVQVHDTGVGIPPEAFEHIFERFYRADPSRHASELHAGLGLSIVKGYVSLLGGTVTVESQVGQGTTFRVRLPAVRLPAAQAA